MEIQMELLMGTGWQWRGELPAVDVVVNQAASEVECVTREVFSPLTVNLGRTVLPD